MERLPRGRIHKIHSTTVMVPDKMIWWFVYLNKDVGYSLMIWPFHIMDQCHALQTARQRSDCVTKSFPKLQAWWLKLQGWIRSPSHYFNLVRRTGEDTLLMHVLFHIFLVYILSAFSIVLSHTHSASFHVLVTFIALHSQQSVLWQSSAYSPAFIFFCSNKPFIKAPCKPSSHNLSSQSGITFLCD